jgi:decaprenyl-phosphate phosphoribosyltransferase
MSKLKAYLRLIRIKHYVKNLFIFAPLFFALKFTDIDRVLLCFAASIVFTAVAGVVYIINDYKDIEQDKLHPTKRFRPLASGEVRPIEAFILAAVFLTWGLVLSYVIHPYMLFLVIIYFLINLAYSFKLKHVAIVDIFIVSSGFIIRLVIGAIVAAVPLTHWIVVMVFLLALFISLAKRKDDLQISKATGNTVRKAIDGYNETFINAAMIMNLAAVLVSYIIYTTMPESMLKFHSVNLYITSIFVIFGVFRYLQIIFVEEKSGSPVEILLKDRLIQLAVVGWIITFLVLIYF